MMVVAVLIFAVVGIMLGVASSILFSPESFLRSAAGKKWMRLVGTKDVRTLRVICRVFIVVVLAVGTLIAVTCFHLPALNQEGWPGKAG